MIGLDERKAQARALFAQGNFTAAESVCREAVATAPDEATAHYNLGVILVKLDRLEEAMACYRKALALDPAFAAAYTNFGFCLNAFNLVEQARQAFSLARRLDPDNPIPVINEGIAALMMGDYETGWRDFAARWRLPSYAKFKRDFPQGEWCGEDLKNKTLLLYAEQGFGDTIQMARYIPLLAARGARIIVESPPALTRLLQTVPGSPRVITKGDALPNFDFYCALMDIPGIFGTRLETIPATTPYLFADAGEVDFYRARLPRGGKKRVGLCWAGRSSHENDVNRSLSFSQLAPLWTQDTVEWVSLQRVVPEKDVKALAASPVLDFGIEFPDFAATAAAIRTLDLVITVDTSVAHLAGALGIETWIVLPFYADWRWLMNRSDNPWYPTARLWRQKKRGGWQEIIEECARSTFIDHPALDSDT